MLCEYDRLSIEERNALNEELSRDLYDSLLNDFRDELIIRPEIPISKITVEGVVFSLCNNIILDMLYIIEAKYMYIVIKKKKIHFYSILYLQQVKSNTMRHRFYIKVNLDIVLEVYCAVSLCELSDINYIQDIETYLKDVYKLDNKLKYKLMTTLNRLDTNKKLTSFITRHRDTCTDHQKRYYSVKKTRNGIHNKVLDNTKYTYVKSILRLIKKGWSEVVLTDLKYLIPLKVMGG